MLSDAHMYNLSLCADIVLVTTLGQPAVRQKETFSVGFNQQCFHSAGAICL